jgi:AcrR family transcriptional regulator
VGRDADRTRRRLLAAATDEFAAFGIAGARIDRIAAAAGCNKAMIYAYYGRKDQLFEAVFTAHVAGYLEQVPFDAADLPGYAGRLFDYFEDHPDALRLSIWYRLERPQGAPMGAVIAANQSRLEQLAGAQRAGLLTAGYTPVELLALVQSVATTWASMNPEFGQAAPDRSRRRATVVDAAARLASARLPGAGPAHPGRPYRVAVRRRRPRARPGAGRPAWPRRASWPPR